MALDYVEKIREYLSIPDLDMPSFLIVSRPEEIRCLDQEHEFVEFGRQFVDLVKILKQDGKLQSAYEYLIFQQCKKCGFVQASNIEFYET